MNRFKFVNFLLAVIVTAGVIAANVNPVSADTGGSSILVTDVGQGNNAKIIRMLLKKNGIREIKFVELATPEDLDGITMMIVGVGASTKGLGAAGLDVEGEAQRAADLLRTARAKSVKVIGVHIGGQARRGEISDMLNELVMKSSDTFIAWKEGDEDGFFTKLAEAKAGAGGDTASSLLRIVENKSAVGTELKGIIDSSS
jgi:hypothetical protein